MSGRDFGRGGRNFGDRRGGFGDRDERRGGFRDREGGFRDRGDRGGRDAGAPPSRPWERRDDAERPARPSGDRPFDRPDRERDVRVERYDEAPPRPPREERFGDRPARFGGDRPTPPRPGGFPPRAPERPATPPTPQRAEEPKSTPPAAPTRPTPAGWSQAHLLDSWNDEARLKGWTPSDQDLQEMVEDNIEGDPQVPGRDQRAITVSASGGVVTLTGAVRSRAVKFAAGSDAYWTFGVTEVRNELDVRPRGAQAGGESAPASGKAKRISKASAIAAAGGATLATNPEEVATPENAATVAIAPSAAPVASAPAGDDDDEGVTPEEVATPENAAAPAMIDDEDDDADEDDEDDDQR